MALATAPSFLSPAAGVTAPGAGAGTGAPGLMGVFAGLVGAADASASTQVGGTTIVALPSVGGEGSNGTAADVALPAGFVSQTLQLVPGAAPLTITGEAEAVSAFVERLQTMVQQVTQSGSLTVGQLGESTDLAAALTQLGVPAEEAAGLAARIETMLKLVEANLNGNSTDATSLSAGGTTAGDALSPETEGELALLMAAVMLAQTSAAQANIPTPATDAASLSTLEGTSFQVSVQVTQTTTVRLAMPPRAFPSGADAARQMVGITVPQAPAPKAAATSGTPALHITVGVQQAGGTQPALALSLPAAPLPDTAPEPVAIPVTPQAEAAQPAPQTIAVQAAVAQAVVPQPTVTAVQKDDVLAAPEGVTLYRLEKAHGVETLQALAPAPDAPSATLQPNAALAAQQGMAAQVAAGGGAMQQAASTTSEALSSFGERLSEARQMQATQQVVVQMKPLLEHGGGTVRMTLNPPELGQVTVDLKVEDGKVHGVLAATQPAVVEQLARELHSLRQGLANAGLQLGEQGLSLMLSAEHHNSQGQQHGQGRGSSGQRGASGSLDGAEGPTETAANWVSPDRVVDVRI